MPLMQLPIQYLAVLEDPGSNDQPTEPRIWVMIVILVISLLAVSFPGLSKSIPFLRIPHIVFFVGKHFGTGVILATAFIHLLQDSFEALQKRQVKEHFNNIGKYTGLIILTSLLTIFLIEYLSTSYVDHLHAEPSLPPTPASSRSSSPRRSKSSVLKSSSNVVEPVIISASQQLPSLPRGRSERGDIRPPSTDETTPLLRPPRTQSTPQIALPHAHAHSHTHTHAHHVHHGHLPAIVTQEAAVGIPIEVLTNSPRIIKMRGCTCLVGNACVCPTSALGAHAPSPKDLPTTDRSRSRSKLRVDVTAPCSPIVSLTEGCEDTRRRRREKGKEAQPRIGRKRQVIGLLVLQLGIMIHSFVIGLTLAITTGADFTSLTTAVIFHQLFEGLSLGIRIAALLPSSPDGDEESSNAGGSKPESGARQGFIRRFIPNIRGERGEGWLRRVLGILFAITTPTGMGLGMILFEVGAKKEGAALARMYLTQGLMSAISAGMLIYASTVEMIAGDFVFGDVEGHGHLGHGHSHDLPSTGDEENQRQSRGKSRSDLPRLVEGNEELDGDVAENEVTITEQVDEEALESEESQYHHHHHHAKIGKKILAVASLLAGVGGMVLIGLGE